MWILPQLKNYLSELCIKVFVEKWEKSRLEQMERHMLSLDRTTQHYRGVHKLILNFVEKQTWKNSSKNTEKENFEEGLVLADIKTSYKASIIKTNSMALVCEYSQ